MQTDLKYLFKSFNLSNSQKRLFNSISREPTAHLYSQDYMARNQLTRGGIGSALRRLKRLNLLVQEEDGVWQINPPEMRRWYKAVGESLEIAEKLQFAELENPYFWHPVLQSVFKRCIEVFGDTDKATHWLRLSNHALGDKSPWDLLDTTEGVELVMRILGRIEHGVYS